MARTKEQARKIDPNKPRPVPIKTAATSSGAGTRANPPRAGRPVQKPPVQVYRRKPAPKKKERTPAEQAATETEIEEIIEGGLRDETEDEEEAPAPASKQVKKRKRVPPTTTNPTSAQLYEKLKGAIKWRSMRFPDPEALRTLGLYEDVRLILHNMGMESLLSMSYGVYEEVSCQFLSTFTAFYHGYEHETEGFGHISFKIHGKTHTVGYKKLSSIFGFQDKRVAYVPTKSKIVSDIWVEISGRTRVAGEDKSTHISNPAVIYAHKVLNHTFYSRREPSGVNNDELKLLALGLLPVIGDSLLHTTPRDFEDMGLVGLLMKRFGYYRDWAWTSQNGTLKLFIGSLITPILEALGIDLGPQDHPPASIDIPYLKKTHFLGGKEEHRFVYPFWSRDKKPVQLCIFLPCERLTTLSDPQHIAFTPAAHELIPSGYGPFDNITKPRKKKARASSSQAAWSSDADDEGPITPAPMYGTERYYFKPYSGVISNMALRQSLSQNAKLLRWNKMQDSTIYKLKNSVKALKRQMKMVTSLLSQVSISSGCQSDDVMAGASPSTLQFPIYYGPPRSPEYQLRRKHRNKAPPTRESSNESPSVATADDDDTEGASSFA
ncbi:hypothetical protein HA466_0009500 [Hirschfeldia incana]|nr:hypothetical protein HA466_0009500 [Hirschfeldia incana]